MDSDTLLVKTELIAESDKGYLKVLTLHY